MSWLRRAAFPYRSSIIRSPAQRLWLGRQEAQPDRSGRPACEDDLEQLGVDYDRDAGTLAVVVRFHFPITKASGHEPFVRFATDGIWRGPVIDDAVADRGVAPQTLTLGTDNGTAFTSRAFRPRLAEHEIVHRRGGYRDPESQAFIESWFSTLKQRCVWREEFETLDEARHKIGAYIDRYHHRPHSGLAYRTPREVAATWQRHDDQSIPAA